MARTAAAGVADVDRAQSRARGRAGEHGRWAAGPGPEPAGPAPGRRVRPLRVACIGGGPGGLYFAALVKQVDPDAQVEVWERNAPGDTFGFGVVFSEETLGGIERADPAVYAAMEREFARWDDLDVHYGGEVITCGGHGYASMSRHRLLAILQDRCRELGVRLHFGRTGPPVEQLVAGHDLVVAADGVHSATRTARAEVFGTRVEDHRCRFVWLGTDKVFDAFRFDIMPTEYGVMQLHGHPYSADASTFIVEMREEVWRAAGLDQQDPVVACEKLFTDVLDGHTLFGHARPHWSTFRTVTNTTWRDGNLVLLGDAAHTVHFSTGSGTKLAMEDALVLAARLHERRTVDEALVAYEEERRPVVESLQRAGRASLEWFENLEQYLGQPPHRFGFNLLTRSRRITHGNLRLRDPEFTAEVERACAVPQGTPPMFTPLPLRGLTLHNRVVVPPMDVYSAASNDRGAQDGDPDDFHLVHLGARALGGAGLVMTETVSVSPEGRVGPGCAGLWNDRQEGGWRRVADFVHEHSNAAIGLRLGHSGRKGSTRLMWEGMDEPLPGHNRPLCAPSPVPWRRGLSQIPHSLTTAEIAAIRQEFVRAAQRGARAGFDLLELHYAHGFLLSSFLSPLTNRRGDAYGGTLANRLRFPLEVLDAVRQQAWPGDRPLSIRISATDWAGDGNNGEDAVQIARSLAEHGADIVHVSSGQVAADDRTGYGRLHQSGLADRIRHAAGVPVIAVGAVFSYDDINSLVLAGRADLCALGRPHLYDPHWTLHAAADQGYAGPGAVWPAQYQAGNRPPRTGRADIRKPNLDTRTRHRRWHGAPTP